jgi:hypothetical protein
MDVNDEHPEKQLLPILITNFGIVMDVNDEILENNCIQFH